MNSKHYLVLYYLFVKQSIIQQSQYRTHFIFDMCNNVVWSMLRVIFYGVAFTQIAVVGSWTKEKALILAAVFLIIQSIMKVLFETNFYDFVRTIYKGELDFVLLKPISAQFYLSLRKFRPASLIRMLMGLGILYLTLTASHIPISVAEIGLFCWSLLISILVIYSLEFIVLCGVFWFGNVENIFFMFSPIMSHSFLPYDIFPNSIVNFISFVIPIIFIATIPAKTLFGLSPLWLAWGTFLAGIFFLLSRFIWHQALKNYTSVSS